MTYRIEYSPSTIGHLEALTARQRSSLLDAVESQLQHEPLTETRNRKRMPPNPLAPWELRIGALRVYYDVEDEPNARVLILAVGVKKRDRLTLGGEEFHI